MNDQPVMEFTSHVAGRNANVAIYPDRIEWARTGLGVTLGLLSEAEFADQKARLLGSWGSS